MRVIAPAWLALFSLRRIRGLCSLLSFRTTPLVLILNFEHYISSTSLETYFVYYVILFFKIFHCATRPISIPNLAKKIFFTICEIVLSLGYFGFPYLSFFMFLTFFFYYHVVGLQRSFL